MTILSAFNEFPQEAALVGRMLAGYADIEIDLMHCAAAVRGDLDLTIKAMFLGRGNSQRVSIAAAIARPPYGELGLAVELNEAITAVRKCLRIRNLYAHCTWWSDHSGQLAFANLEDLAKGKEIVTDLQELSINHVSVPHLERQLAYFEYASQMLIGILNEGNRRAERPDHPGSAIPETIEPPPIYL